MNFKVGKNKIVVLCILAVVLIIVNLCSVWRYFAAPPFQHERKEFRETDTHNGGRSDGNYDVLLMAYMRSGSTMLGETLGWRNDSFYWFEPFWHITRYGYFREDGNECFIDGNKCRHSSIGQEAIYDILRRIYTCNFDTDFLGRIVHFRETQKYSGKQWDSYQNCAVSGVFKNCSEILSRVCRKAQRRVIKVLRLTTTFALEMLETFPRLKVVHLIRDPRAIINSAKYTKWFILDKTSSLERFKLFSREYCKKMKHDIKSSIALMSKYPDRVKIVQYEDLLTGNNAMNCLFKFLNIQYINSKDLHNSSAYNWRMANVGLTEAEIHAVDESCIDVYEDLGYNEIYSGSVSVRSLNHSVMVPFKYQCV